MVNISSTLTRQTKHKHDYTFKGTLTISNKSNIAYTNWTITCTLPVHSSIDSVQHFTIKRINQSQISLVPKPNVAILSANLTIVEQFTGNGKVFPSNFTFITTNNNNGFQSFTGSTYQATGTRLNYTRFTGIAHTGYTGLQYTGFTGYTGYTGYTGLSMAHYSSFTSFTSYAKNAPTGPTVIYNVPMTDILQVQTSGLMHQYSYNQQVGYTGPPNPDYFIINNNGLQINIYPTDNSYEINGFTYPKTIITGKEGIFNDNIQYSLIFDETRTILDPSYNFCYFQINSGMNQLPNLLLRQYNGYYQLVSGLTVLQMPFTAQDDLNITVNWKINFVLSNSNIGIVQVIKDGDIIAQITGNTAGKNNSSLSLGLNSVKQQPLTSQTHIKNLFLAQTFSGGNF